jgi:hypothetical protein
MIKGVNYPVSSALIQIVIAINRLRCDGQVSMKALAPLYKSNAQVRVGRNHAKVS